MGGGLNLEGAPRSTNLYAWIWKRGKKPKFLGGHLPLGLRLKDNRGPVWLGGQLSRGGGDILCHWRGRHSFGGGLEAEGALAPHPVCCVYMCELVCLGSQRANLSKVQQNKSGANFQPLVVEFVCSNLIRWKKGIQGWGGGWRLRGAPSSTSRWPASLASTGGLPLRNASMPAGRLPNIYLDIGGNFLNGFLRYIPENIKKTSVNDVVKKHINWLTTQQEYEDHVIVRQENGYCTMGRGSLTDRMLPVEKNNKG